MNGYLYTTSRNEQLQISQKNEKKTIESVHNIHYKNWEYECIEINQLCYSITLNMDSFVGKIKY